HDTRASNGRAPQATKPVLYSHAVIVIPFRISRKLIQRLFKTKKRHFQHCESIRPKNILGAAGAAFRTGGIDYQLGYIDTLKPELHGTTKESDKLLSKDLPALNQSLKMKGLQPIPATSPSVRARDTKHGSGGTVGARA